MEGLDTEPRPSCVLGVCCATELHLPALTLCFELWKPETFHLVWPSLALPQIKHCTTTWPFPDHTGNTRSYFRSPR